MTIETACGPVGLVHADLPHPDWRVATAMLEAETSDDGGTALLGVDAPEDEVRRHLLFRRLFYDRSPGLFRAMGTRISHGVPWSSEAGEAGAVSDGRRRIKPLRGSFASLRPCG